MWLLAATTLARELQRRRSCRFFYTSRPMQEDISGNDLSSHIYVTSDFCDHRGMQLCFLGTSSSIPTVKRNTSCLAVRLDSVIYLFDCGEGLLSGLSVAGNLSQPINIYGPEGLRMWIRTTLKSCYGRVPSKYAVHELKVGKRPGKGTGQVKEVGMHHDELLGQDYYSSHDSLWHIVNDKKYLVKAGLLKHSVPCWGFVIEEQSRPGRLILLVFEGDFFFYGDVGNCAPHFIFWGGAESARKVFVHRIWIMGYAAFHKLYFEFFCFNKIPIWVCLPISNRFSVERARDLGVIPGRDFALLQKGHSITLEDGRKIIPSDVLGHSRRGRKLVVLGDTYDSSSLLSAAEGADVLVHECTILEDDASEAVKRFHSTGTMAGKFARAIGTRCLVLTHFSCKYEGRPDLIQASIEAAQTAFHNKNVVAAKDLLAVTVRQTDEPA